ncbi:thioesterase domain-containing protein [Bailinhaonella thermotolerans]|uniref:Alpha/beta fold hydrolase n=1 Tax=Bailinhaonella thermotolerans TaxID=1070861 RepID=A0A3A4A1W6_9ACTN|nr:thioesterase domain-containing protein [Bailinhaonella thermotolerans]RJL21437.1 alpha/beta fold hydrolase [Bailinhaonella thermotolerans]
MSDWFSTPHHRPGARARLFCLPYAGAGAAAFRGWSAAAGPDVEVLAAVLPGRESRIRDNAPFDLAELATEVAALADRPYAIYGHSMGGRIGFELVRELRRRGVRPPVRLYLGGCRPPGLADPLAGLSAVDDETLLARLSALGGMPAELLSEPELLDLVLPALRADFGWLDAYRHREEDPLPVPITAFAGSEDPAVPAEAMRHWAAHTAAGFGLRVEPGGHFFLHEARDRILGEIRADLAAATRGHLIPLGDTGWSVWRDAILRSTGFPADGLDLFAAPGCAEAADDLLAGRTDAALFDKAFAEALAEGAARASELAADPLFREAVTWQNRNALTALDGLVRGGPEERRNHERRARELLVAKYWQRYCAKNETIGFFGPVTWTEIDPAAPAATVAPGPRPLRRRRVSFEDWAVRAYAGTLAADPGFRRLMPVGLRPHLTLRGRELLRPAQPPLALSAAEAAVLAHCDGRRSAADVAALAAGAAGIRTEADALLLLDRLDERELLSFGHDLAQDPDAEVRLRDLLGRVAAADPAYDVSGALAGLDRLCAARDRVADAAGDPGALKAALDALDEEFTAVTGLPAARRAGQTYAGRGLVYEDTVRDVDVRFGGPLLTELAEPLALLLRAARWLTAALADAYGAALRELYEELRAEGGEVRLSDVWFLAQGLLFGSGPRPVDEVAREFARRWAALFGLDRPADGELRFTAAELAEAVAATFPADRPGWSSARLHSPDLQICADSAEAIERGDYLVVLGEMHAAWPTFDCAVFTRAHPDPGSLRDALAADLGPHRVRPLYPADWPRYTGRVSHSLDGPADRQLGWTSAPGADPDRLLPATSVLVTEEEGELIARAPDGRRWPLLEMFASLVSMHAVDGFKLTGAATHEHTPRISIDRLVVARETWRTTVGATGLTSARGERDCYLAVRAWRRALGLPERVFVKLSTEIKPTYVDLGSPLYASLLCAMLRRAGDESARLVITELLPGPGQAWLADAEGRRYFTELRLHATDPVPAWGTT